MLNRLKTNDQNWRNPPTIINQGSKSPQKHNYQNYHPNYQGDANYQNINNMNNMMSNSNVGKGKPLISPKKNINQQKNKAHLHNNRLSQQLVGRDRFVQSKVMTERNEHMTNCITHPNKKAQFTAGMDEADQLEYYCGRCAAQLATRGIEVQRIETNRNKVMMKSKRQNDLPHYPQYANEPIYQQILEILSMSNQVVRQHNQNIEKFSSLQSHYQQQIVSTKIFYNRLIEIIQEMKTHHLEDLQQERDNNTQIADIQNDNLRENIIEINDIKNDIENHLEEVVEGIRETGDASECKESLEHYRQKLTLCRHLTEEQIDTLKQVTHYPQNKYDYMMDNFQNFLRVLWNDPENPMEPQNGPSQQHRMRPEVGKNLNSAMTVKNIHQILPRGVNYQNCEGKKAFRNLQEDQEEQVLDRKSPIFKQI